MTPIRALSVLLTGAGLIALILAATSIYAAIAQVVLGRRREFGLRVALGASPPRVGWLMLGGALGLTMSGILLGAPCVVLAAVALRSALFGVASPSVSVVLACAGALVVVTVAASVGPCRAAMRADPTTLLRSE